MPQPVLLRRAGGVRIRGREDDHRRPAAAASCLPRSCRPARHNGVLFDREHMLPVAKEHLSSTLDPDRFTLVAGDFFESVRWARTCTCCRGSAGRDDSACITCSPMCGGRSAGLDAVKTAHPERRDNRPPPRATVFETCTCCWMRRGGTQPRGIQVLLGGRGMRLNHPRPPLETTLLVARAA